MYVCVYVYMYIQIHTGRRRATAESVANAIIQDISLTDSSDDDIKPLHNRSSTAAVVHKRGYLQKMRSRSPPASKGAGGWSIASCKNAARNSANENVCTYTKGHGNIHILESSSFFCKRWRILSAKRILQM